MTVGHTITALNLRYPSVVSPNTATKPVINPLSDRAVELVFGSAKQSGATISESKSGPKELRFHRFVLRLAAGC